MSKTAFRRRLMIAIAHVFAVTGLATVALAQNAAPTSQTIQVITPLPGKGPKVTKDANWKATDPKNLQRLRALAPKAVIQVIVVSAEELAALGVKGNGRVIYRYVHGVLQIIVTSQYEAANVVMQFPDHSQLPPASATPPEPQPNGKTNSTPNPNGAGPLDESPFETPWKNPGISPRDFHENPIQENISPS